MRFLVVYSWNFRFHFLLKLLSKSLSTCFRLIQSLVQQVGGICCGSVVERVKMRRRQAWHMRCSQGSRADLEMGTSSERQVMHSTLSAFGSAEAWKDFKVCKAHCRSGLGGLAGAAGLAGVGGPNMEPKILDGRPAGLFPLVVEGARSNFSRTGGDVGWANDRGRP